MARFLGLLSALASQFFRSRRDLLLENLALRQQLAILRRRHPQPRFAPSDRFFWVMLRRIWDEWKWALVLVQPETVVRGTELALKYIGPGFRGIEFAQIGSVSAGNYAT